MSQQNDILDGNQAYTSADQITVEIWKKTVDVQQHFNDICLRIRNLAITVLTAFIAAIGLSLKDGIFVDFFGAELSLAFLSAVGGLVVWAVFFFMDRYWYHHLLLGSVNYGLELENKNERIFGVLGLAGHISKASPIKIGSKSITSNAKFHFFYTVIAGLLLTTSIILFNLEPVIVNVDDTANLVNTSKAVTDQQSTESNQPPTPVAKSQRPWSLR